MQHKSNRAPALVLAGKVVNRCYIAMSFASVLSMIWMILIVSSFYRVTEIEANECIHTPSKCGNMDIPFPFIIRGTVDSCGLPGFEIDCKKNESFGTTQPLPFLQTLSGDVRIVNFSDNHILVNSTPFSASSCDGFNGTKGIGSKGFGIKSDGPFRISVNNTFVALGCDSLGVLVTAYTESDADQENDLFYGGCISVCNRYPRLSNCTGDGCCRAPLPPNYTQFGVAANANVNLTAGKVKHHSNCTYAAVVDMPTWDIVSRSGIDKFKQEDLYMRLDWAILNETCSLEPNNRSTSSHCDQNADCNLLEWGIVCKCRDGYEGDGYLKGTRCKDIDECSDSHLNECKAPEEGGGCKNTNGSYDCFCRKGHGDGLRYGTGCESTIFPALPVTIGVFATLVAVLVGVALLFWIYRRRKSWLAKQKNFRLNGGEHLQNLISSRGEATRIFSLDEIEKATNNFSDSFILGSGGYGTVYKGTLPDGLVVAIKKSKSLEIDSNEINQFINEIVILTNINHRNVVKVLGCCLESPVPLLIYEYISNGTLFEHLYEDKYEQSLGWEDRLRIATETAEALSYLHSSASIPIIHRDVKSSNILLDQGCTPKVADFGVSRLVPIDQTHITTVVQGTMGYLDPEYFQTVQLTEKSDVYSFGVVLVELITGLKPVSYERTKNHSNLAIFFLSKLKTQDLLDILDPGLNLEDSRCVDSMQRVAKLAKECLNVEGEKRPTMKEVVQELLWIRGGSTVHAWTDGKAAEKEEEMVALIVEDEARSDGFQLFKTGGQVSTTFSTGIEGFKDSLRRGR